MTATRASPTRCRAHDSQFAPRPGTRRLTHREAVLPGAPHGSSPGGEAIAPRYGTRLPGGFPDPTSPHGYRYWDGAVWSNHAADDPERSGGRGGLVATLLFTLGGVLFLATISASLSSGLNAISTPLGALSAVLIVAALVVGLRKVARRRVRETPLSHDIVPAELAPSRRALLTAAALIAASLTLFILIAEDLLDGGGLISRDDAVLAWFVDHRTDRWIDAAKVISTIGSFASLSIIGLLLGVWLWRRGWHLGLAVGPLLSVILGGLAASVAKAVFDRPRPPISAHTTSTSSAAFPSGHATDAAAFFLAASFVLALTIIRRQSMRVLSITVGVLLAGLVGISRLVLGVHWLSDVVAGWALGTSIAITVVVALWYLTTRPTTRPPPATPTRNEDPTPESGKVVKQA